MSDKLDKVAPPGREDQIMKLKSKFPGQPKKAFKIAWSSYDKSKDAKKMELGGGVNALPPVQNHQDAYKAEVDEMCKSVLVGKSADDSYRVSAAKNEAGAWEYSVEHKKSEAFDWKKVAGISKSLEDAKAAAVMHKSELYIDTVKENDQEKRLVTVDGKTKRDGPVPPADVKDIPQVDPHGEGGDAEMKAKKVEGGKTHHNESKGGSSVPKEPKNYVSKIGAETATSQKGDVESSVKKQELKATSPISAKRKLVQDGPAGGSRPVMKGDGRPVGKAESPIMKRRQAKAKRDHEAFQRKQQTPGNIRHDPRPEMPGDRIENNKYVAKGDGPGGGRVIVKADVPTAKPPSGKAPAAAPKLPVSKPVVPKLPPVTPKMTKGGGYGPIPFGKQEPLRKPEACKKCSNMHKTDEVCKGLDKAAMVRPPLKTALEHERTVGAAPTGSAAPKATLPTPSQHEDRASSFADFTPPSDFHARSPVLSRSPSMKLPKGPTGVFGKAEPKTKK